MATLYKGKETDDFYIAQASEGKTDSEIAAALGISVKTFYNWEAKHDGFKQARLIGFEACKAWWDAYLRDKSTGHKYKDGSFAAARFLMMNKFGYNDRIMQQIEQGDKVVTVNIVDPAKG